MIRAILAGKKSQTRRVISRPLKHPNWTGYMCVPEKGIAIECGPDYPDDASDVVRCPYGKLGDRLWVRESFQRGKPALPNGLGFVIADSDEKIIYRADRDDFVPPMKWQPPIFMPRRLSRIDLEVISLRVQRLQQISDFDAWAEGIEQTQSYRDAFPASWDQVNAARGFSWQANPWVWAIEFKRVLNPSQEGRVDALFKA
jgi:hypothetical protein